VQNNRVDNSANFSSHNSFLLQDDVDNRRDMGGRNGEYGSGGGGGTLQHFPQFLLLYRCV
jgi:hypothetical protein